MDTIWWDYRQDYQEDYDYFDVEDDEREEAYLWWQDSKQYWFDENLFNWNILIKYFGHEF